ncbi:MAG: hypothetical protein AB8G18_01785 [Gammaproteobacteria bacterium]
MNTGLTPKTRTVFIGLVLACCVTLITAGAQEHVDADYTNGQGAEYVGDGLVSWVDGERWDNWRSEKAKREQALQQYLNESNGELSADWGFRQKGDYAQNPKLGWKWFEESPVGFGGVPFVMLKTIMDLDAKNCKTRRYDLCEMAEIWKRPATIEFGLKGLERSNLDHLGFGPHPDDYKNGVAVAPTNRKWPLPYGMVFQSGNPKYVDDDGPFFEPIETLDRIVNSPDSLIEDFIRERSGVNDDQLSPAAKRRYLRKALKVLLKNPKTSLKVALLAGKISLFNMNVINEAFEKSRPPYAENYEDDYSAFGKTAGMDRVFFSCAACHVGRVMVDNPGAPARMVHLPGSPNTEIEVQYYSKLLMLTGASLVESGFDLESKEFADPENIKPDTDIMIGLYQAMLHKVITDPGSFYGTSDSQKLRAEYMVWRAAVNFPAIAKDLISTAVKTHYIYYVVAAQNGFNAEKQIKAGRMDDASQMPDLMNNRVGQMDAFGIASGLVALHSIRPDQSFIRFMYDDVLVDGVPVFGATPGDSPVFKGFPYMEGPLSKDLSALPLDDAAEPVDTSGPMSAQNGVSDAPAMKGQITTAGNRVFGLVDQWAPPVAGAVDVNSLSFSRDRGLANWDGNQGANARTLASGTSATGDPRKVNVEIHEPLNPFINNLPPMPYQWEVDVERARLGRAIFYGETTVGDKKVRCSGCHKPGNETIFPANSKVNVDESRALANNSVSRTMLAGLVLEACTIYRNNNPEKAGNDYCMPKGATQEEKLDDYFADVATRVEKGKHGYKADMLHGIWARAPYLHNGSVPTLGALICPPARPGVFKRGNINYDQELLGFEWQNIPATRYNSKYETVSIKEYDTNMLSRSNKGHEFGSHMCPDLSGLDPVDDRVEITKRILASPVGDLLEYLKTL